MESTFTVPTNREEKTRLMDKVKKEAAAEGIAFAGNEDAGSFNGKTLFGKIAGVYTVEGPTLTVRLTEYPRLLPKGFIHRALQRVFM
jgi:hypothetical protein